MQTSGFCHGLTAKPKTHSHVVTYATITLAGAWKSPISLYRWYNYHLFFGIAKLLKRWGIPSSLLNTSQLKSAATVSPILRYISALQIAPRVHDVQIPITGQYHLTEKAGREVGLLDFKTNIKVNIQCSKQMPTHHNCFIPHSPYSI